MQVRVNQDDIRAFAVALGVLATNAGFDQLLRILVSHGIFIIAHKLYALSGSSVVLKSIEFGHHVQYRTQRGAWRLARGDGEIARRERAGPVARFQERRARPVDDVYVFGHRPTLEKTLTAKEGGKVEPFLRVPCG